MHEYPVTKRIIEIAEEHAAANNSGKVLEINLVVGEYSGYMSECIRMYFDIIAKGTCCEDAVLNIQEVKPKLECEGCGELFERSPFSFECPYCGGDGRPTDIGREFYIKSIVIETD